MLGKKEQKVQAEQSEQAELEEELSIEQAEPEVDIGIEAKLEAACIRQAELEAELSLFEKLEQAEHEECLEKIAAERTWQAKIAELVTHNKLEVLEAMRNHVFLCKCFKCGAAYVLGVSCLRGVKAGFSQY